MPLFAEELSNSTLGIWGAALSGMFAFLTAMLGYMDRRDQRKNDTESKRVQLQHDAKMIQKDAEIAASVASHENCEEKYADLKEDMDSEVARLNRRIDNLTGLHMPLPDPPSGRTPR